MANSVLIIGCGLVGGGSSKDYQSHAKTVSESPHFFLAGGVDPSFEARQKFSTFYDVPTFDSISPALEATRPDIVVVASPSEQHEHSIYQVLCSQHLPKFLIVEKPFCISRESFEATFRNAGNTEMKIFVNHSRRFSQLHQQIRNYVASGFGGGLVGISGAFSSTWMNYGPHAVDLVHMLSESVFDPNPTQWHSSVSDDGSFSVSGRTSSGVPILFSRVPSLFKFFEFQLFFEDTRIRISQFGAVANLASTVKNQSGELVLGDEKSFFKESVAPINGLWNEVVKVDQGAESKAMEAVSLGSIGQTMDDLFFVQDLLTRYSRAQ